MGDVFTEGSAIARKVRHDPKITKGGRGGVAFLNTGVRGELRSYLRWKYRAKEPLEARSPLPAVRLRGLAKLTAAGINAGLIVAPVLPGITDDLPRLEALFRAAREAGARFLHAGPLRLYPAIRERFLPLLEQHFPALAARYRAAYAGSGAAPKGYARALSRRIRRLQARFGFVVNDGMVDRYRSRLPVLQQDLPLDGR